MTDDPWTEYWSDTHDVQNLSEQAQVARTRKGSVISLSRWNSTVKFVHRRFPVQSGHYLLDACGGNGLFAREFLKIGARVKLVDVNEDLATIASSLNHPGLSAESIELLEFLRLNEDRFDRVFLYAGLQYFSEERTVRLLESIKEVTTKGGLVYLGDIPDLAKREEFLKGEGKLGDYFESLKTNRPLMGTWFSKNWLVELSAHLGFRKHEVITQPSFHIYSDFRFDLLLHN